MKKRRLVSITVIAAFFIFCAVSLGNSLTPYVTFAQAKANKSVVQVKGVLASPKITQSPDGDGIIFVLKDESGEEATVHYKGIQPDNLADSSSIVAIGTYRDEKFMADKLLIKCPSKYQGSGNK